MSRWVVRAGLLFLVVLLAGLSGGDLPRASAAPAREAFTLTVQRRDDAGRRFHEEVTIDPARTAVVIIDMWDRHWCRTYTARVANMAPRMNKATAAFRKLGIPIIFAPADVMDFYKDAPQRRAMLAIPSHPLPPTVSFDPPPAPKGDFCECGPNGPCRSHRAHTRQVASLHIAANDYIGDCNNGRELLNFCAERNIDTLIYMGVASNMCICYRSMGAVNMRRHGMRTFVVADLVQAITANGINPATREPDDNFTPARGTAIVQKYLEQHIAPTFESRQLLRKAGMDPHARDNRPHAVFVIVDEEYRTDQTLRAFAEQHLKHLRCTFLTARDDAHSIEGLEALADADLLVLSVRRQFLPVAQMDHLERYIRAGKPLVAVRVGVVPFAKGSNQTKNELGSVVWQRFDLEVLGCNYTAYDSRSRQTGTQVTPIAEAADHPIMKGVDLNFHSSSWLYRVQPLAESVTPLAMGQWSEDVPAEPVAWTNEYEDGRVFYTSLGHPNDFREEGFRRMLANAIDWALAE